MSSDLDEEGGEIRLEERRAALVALAPVRLLGETEEPPAGVARHRMILDVALRLSQLWRDGRQAERVRMRIGSRREGSPTMAGRVRPQPNPLLQERELIGAGLGESREGTSINMAESRPIKLNQTKSNLQGRGWVDGATAAKRRGNLVRCCGCVTFACYRGYFFGLARIKPHECESSRIKPNQTCSMVCAPPPYVDGYARRSCGCATCGSYHGLVRWRCWNQGESNQIKPARPQMDLPVAKEGAKCSPVKPSPTRSNPGGLGD
jgi:hypothetical protein